jgi:hypothetical protein
MEEDRWLSVDEIAHHLGIKRDTVYSWVHGRQMPGHKIGRLWKFKKTEVDAWVKSAGPKDFSPSLKKEKAPHSFHEEILQLLREHTPDMVNRFSVKKIGLFGSFVRSASDSRSDVDLLVEFEEPTFDHYMDLKHYLEVLLNRPVDLVLADSIKPRLKPLIAEEAVYV